RGGRQDRLDDETLVASGRENATARRRGLGGEQGKGGLGAAVVDEDGRGTGVTSRLYERGRRLPGALPQRGSDAGGVERVHAAITRRSRLERLRIEEVGVR